MLLTLLVACGGDVIQHSDGDTADTDEGAVRISTIDPEHGPAAGGTLVRISGTGFTTAGVVTVGGESCAELTFLNSTELYCTTPPGAVGDAAVEVTETTGTGRATFSYDADVVDTGDTGDTDTPPEITACTLDSPLTMAVPEGTPSGAVLASVTIPERTDYEGAPVGVEAEVGYGARGADPATWAWKTASWSTQAGTADQYTGTLTFDREGSYDYSARFRVDHGPWSVCTASTGGYGEADVTPDMGVVDYCHVQWPCSLTVRAGAESEDVYAWVYEYEVTQGTGQGAGVTVQLGVGPDGADPESTTSGWVWSTMAYYADKDGLSEGDKANDEYAGSFIGPGTAGSYDYVARASLDGGTTWVLCDLGGDSCSYGGSSDGYDDPGTCTVE